MRPHISSCVIGSGICECSSDGLQDEGNDIEGYERDGDCASGERGEVRAVGEEEAGESEIDGGREEDWCDSYTDQVAADC